MPLAGRVDQLLAADHTLQGNHLARLLRLALKIYLIEILNLSPIWLQQNRQADPGNI